MLKLLFHLISLYLISDWWIAFYFNQWLFWRYYIFLSFTSIMLFLEKRIWGAGVSNLIFKPKSFVFSLSLFFITFTINRNNFIETLILLNFTLLNFWFMNSILYFKQWLFWRYYIFLSFIFFNFRRRIWSAGVYNLIFKPKLFLFLSLFL